MEPRRLLNVDRESEVSTWLVVTMIKLITCGLLLVCLLVPLVRRTEDGVGLGRGLFGLIRLISDEAYSFGDGLHTYDEIPQWITIGLLVARVGVFLWCLGVLAVGVTTVELITSAQRRDKVLVRVAASMLLLGGALVALGLRWLPFHRDAALGPAWGLWVSVFVAIWVLVLHAKACELGENG